MSNELQGNIDVPTVYDHSYSGGIDSSGNIEQLWGEDALNNSLKMWLASFTGEILRQPQRGGYLMYWLLKPMSEKNIKNIKMTLQDGFNQDFSPYLEVYNLNVEPLYDERCWHIQMEVYSHTYKVRTIIDEKIKNRV